MAKYVVFDFDGTLVDSKAVFISAYNQLAGKYRFNKIDEQGIPQLIKLSMRDRMRVLKVPFYKLPVLTAEFISLYNKSIHSINLMAGMADVLKALENSGYKTAIISSNAVHSIRQFLQNNQLDFIKDVYSSSRLFGKDKVISKFLQKNRLQKTEVIYVGDEERDVIACKKSGIRIVWVAWGFEVKEVVINSKPHFMAHTPGELLEIVQTQLV
jgi:phosphoglycolate phosphatase